MAALSPRLSRRIEADFPGRSNEVMTSLAALRRELFGGSADTPDGAERVLAGILLLADGDPQRLDNAVTLARTDWRDLLVAAGLEQTDWPDRLDIAFGRA